MLFCPHTVSQDNGTACFLTYEAEHVISGRMSNKSPEMEPVLLIRPLQCGAVKLTQGLTDLFSGDGKTPQNLYHFRASADSRVSNTCPGFVWYVLEVANIARADKPDLGSDTAGSPVLCSALGLNEQYHSM